MRARSNRRATALRTIALSACASLLFAGCGSSTVALTPQRPLLLDLGNPPEVASSHGVASLTLTAMLDPTTSAPAIAYDGALVPPTIRVSPGDTIDLTYVNALPASSSEPLDGTNLHFHGLSGSPNPPGDDAIGTLAMPGQTLHYQVIVPASQPPGVYFYHSHVHGEADWQVTNGMSGAIVVTGIAAISRETAGIPERVIMLRNVLNVPSFAALGGLANVPGGSSRRRSATAPASTCSLVSNEHTTIDGNPAGAQILMQPGKPQLWRVVNASADGYYDLSVDGQNLHLVSMDGVPIATYPGAAETNVPDIVMPPASRADFIVTGPALGGEAFRTTCFDTGAGGSPNPSQILGVIATGSTRVANVAQPPATPRVKGTYDEAIGAPTVQRTLQFGEIPQLGKYLLNGRQYDPAGPPMFAAKSGTVEEWTLVNDSTDLHAFHIHQAHFIVLDINGVAQPAMWRDTVNLPYIAADGTPSTTHVLIDFRDPAIRGTFLFHCHILKHEDGGMMAKIAVQ